MLQGSTAVGERHSRLCSSPQPCQPNRAQQNPEPHQGLAALQQGRAGGDVQGRSHLHQGRWRHRQRAEPAGGRGGPSGYVPHAPGLHQGHFQKGATGMTLQLHCRVDPYHTASYWSATAGVACAGACGRPSAGWVHHYNCSLPSIVGAYENAK